METNLAVAKAVRDSVGYDVDMMLDAWMSWDLRYAKKMAGKLERYEPT